MKDLEPYEYKGCFILVGAVWVTVDPQGNVIERGRSKNVEEAKRSIDAYRSDEGISNDIETLGGFKR